MRQLHVTQLITTNTSQKHNKQVRRNDRHIIMVIIMIIRQHIRRHIRIINKYE